MKTRWQQLGLKDTYETGELIILSSPGDDTIQKNHQFYLRHGKNEKKIRLDLKRSSNDGTFIEFYALEPGEYQISAPWGTAGFHVTQRVGLSFQKEFGIFTVAVVILVLLMARRYLYKPKRKDKKNVSNC